MPELYSSSNGPVTQAQLELALERAERHLSQDNELLAFAKEKLEAKGLVYGDDLGTVSLLGVLSPEVYFQTGSPMVPMERKSLNTP